MSKAIKQIKRGNINRIFSTESSSLHRALTITKNKERSKADREDARTIAIWKLFLKGWSLRKIADALGISHISVKEGLDTIKWLREKHADLPLLPPREDDFGFPIIMNRKERRRQGLKI